MEKNPFTFDKSNPRLVVNAQRDSRATASAGAIWFASVFYYNKWFFRKDKNIVNMMGFALLSVPAAFAYGNLIFGSAQTEAAIMNNQSERLH
jgi:hypothetical protein